MIVLSDIKTGVVLWDNEGFISKVIARDKLQEFDGIESKQNNHYERYAKPNKDKQYSYAGEKTKEFFRNAGYKTKEFLAKSYDITKNFILGFGHKNHIVLGYLRDIGENWAFALNFIYNYTVASFDSYELEATTYSIEFGSKKLTSTIQRLGGEILIYCKLLEKLHIFVGSGVLKDIGSKYNISFEVGSRNWFEDDIYINVVGQKRFNFESKIDSWYPIVKIGGLFIFGYFGVEGTIYCSWATKEENYLGTNCGVSVGLQARY